MSFAQSFIPRPRGSVEGSPTVDGPIVARYRDHQSGCTFVVGTPAAQPLLWQAYLRGANRSYRRYGVESVLEYDVIADGKSTALFFVAIDSRGVDSPGAVVGGMRTQGPYTEAVQAHALAEWAGRPGASELQEEIASRLADGVTEMKNGWVEDSFGRRAALTDALARIFVHALHLMDVRWALGTVAQHAVPRWRTTGGVVSDDVCPVAYPDARYLTVPMWWDREKYADVAAPEQLPHIMRESSQLVATPDRSRDDSARVSS